MMNQDLKQINIVHSLTGGGMMVKPGMNKPPMMPPKKPMMNKTGDHEELPGTMPPKQMPPKQMPPKEMPPKEMPPDQVPVEQMPPKEMPVKQSKYIKCGKIVPFKDIL